MRVFITGAKGQLGRAFVELFESNGWDYSAADVDALDISSPDAVKEAMQSYRPGLILNCAAYNLVDKAEADPAAAFAVNSEGPRNLAFAAKRLEAKLVHFGTDYVFDGRKNVPYMESDAAAPLNNYGKSKLKGEGYVLESPGGLVLRLSWVFGKGSQNFIHKLKSWASGSGALRISADEVSVPTYTRDIVEVTMSALSSGLTGLWHLTNTGACSRYDWAKHVLKELGIRKEISPAAMSEFALPARRPGFSAMSNNAISRELGKNIPAWEDAVARFIGEEK